MKSIFASAGSRSMFYIIDNKRGFKTFDTYEDAEYAHNVQCELAKHNLAPLVYSDVVRRIVDKHKSWGFETEIAEMLGCGGNDCDCGKCEDIWESKSRSINNLCKKMEEIGFHFADNHVGNIGYVKRNGRRKLVCIDTGCESVNSDYDSYEDEVCSCTACRRLS
jgi:hypothetical protein